MGHFVILISSTFTRKKAFLAHVKIEAFQTSISKIDIFNIHTLYTHLFVNNSEGWKLLKLHFLKNLQRI